MMRRAVGLAAIVAICASGSALAPVTATARDRIVLPKLNMKGVKVERRGRSVVIGMRGRILFDYDRAVLRLAAYQTLARISQALQRHYPWSPLRIEGHTDSHGDAAYNYRLSLARAAAVRQGFRQFGIPGYRLRTRGYGEMRPVAPNAFPDGRDNPQGRQANRRVEIVVLWPYRRPYLQGSKPR